MKKRPALIYGTFGDDKQEFGFATFFLNPLMFSSWLSEILRKKWKQFISKIFPK